jgi:peptidyl-prolyl cis-trans isomerase C
LIRDDDNPTTGKENVMKSRLLVLLLALTFGAMGTLWGFASAAPPPSPAKAVAAQVNGRSITYQELNTEFHARTRRPFETVEADPQWQRIRKQILEQIINEELLEEEATRQKLSVSPEAVDARFKNLQARFPSPEVFNQELSRRGLTADQLKQNIRKGLLRHELLEKEVLKKIAASPQELDAFYQAHKDKYVQEEAVHARHILIRVAPDASPEDDKQAKEKATAVLVKGKNGEDFAQLATEYSEGPTKDKGGDLGTFGRGQMLKPFEDAAFSLKAGEIGGPVRTKFGYHIIKVEEKHAFKQLPYQEVQSQVKDDFMNEKANARYQEYVAQLRKKAKITVNLK